MVNVKPKILSALSKIKYRIKGEIDFGNNGIDLEINKFMLEGLLDIKVRTDAYAIKYDLEKYFSWDG